MPLSEQEILQVLELFQKSDWQDLQLNSGDVRLSISKTGRPRPAMTAAALVCEAASTVPTPVASAVPAAAAPAKPAVDPRWIAVKAPMLGHFYSAPKPGAPPFVTLGQTVEAEDTVAILEVMKLMNHVKAGVRGRVALLPVGNGDLVEFEQAMLYIDPAPGEAGRGDPA